ncbi:MAG: hypothetical protein J7M13_06000 [Synergistetes bacterium]|nr:hypothetical protein [Synergistota bacterium]
MLVKGKGGKKFLLFLLISFLIFSSSCGSGSPTTLSISDLAVGIKEGVEKQLRSPEGLLYKSTKDKSFLSETIGLELMWHLLDEDKSAFDYQFSLLKKYFISPLGLLYWKISEDFDRFKSNASIDDLRVCKALILAYRKWGDNEYLNTAKEIGNALLKYVIKKDILLDGISWEPAGIFGGISIDQGAKSITLSYPDIQAMLLLKEYNSDWLKVVVKTSGIVLMGALLKGTDVYWGYDIESESYNDRDRNLINEFLHLLHLASAGSVPIDHVRYFAFKLDVEDGIFDENGNENVAVYSLASLLFYESGFYMEAEACLEKLKKFRLDSGLLGYPSEDGGTEAWAFDNLLALIAIETISGSPKK